MRMLHVWIQRTFESSAIYLFALRTSNNVHLYAHVNVYATSFATTEFGACKRVLGTDKRCVYLWKLRIKGQRVTSAS